ncbi:Ferredoxin [Halomicrobium zhouii]|uniref:Ferredoxin n=1 Tax=Halomicrobium zhouii TaxID=767519 RepID=A0A1I6LZL8_9EURY|nr:ferredoxin [Halomicrobium zhouii]SFS08712.1 Ferredoxin [Halomicrobium zhouii]
MTDTETATYDVTVDREACDGVFACLVRDPRFVEDEDGLANVDPELAVSVESDGEFVTARFDDGALDDAGQAAAACPLDAISVTEVDG